MEDSRSLQAMVSSSGIGTIIPVDVIRDRKALSFNVKIGEMPGEEDLSTKPAEEKEDWIGLSVRDIPQEMKESLEVQEGVLVRGIKGGSPAEQGGIQPGDIIIAINQKKIRDAAGYKRAISIIKKGATISFLIRREGMTLYLAFRTRR